MEHHIHVVVNLLLTDHERWLELGGTADERPDQETDAGHGCSNFRREAHSARARSPSAHLEHELIHLKRSEHRWQQAGELLHMRHPLLPLDDLDVPKVARSHRIDSEEFYRLPEGEVLDDANLFAERLQQWEDHYNYDRPHGGLAGHTPYERLRQKARDPLS